jgi:hypothetical protein
MKSRYIYYAQPVEVGRFNLHYAPYLNESEETQFRYCKATVGRSGKYIYLRSYNTVVAFINTVTGEGYDMLRTEYGYTATSAQHIAKFFKYYCTGTVYRTYYKNDRIITKVIY